MAVRRRTFLGLLAGAGAAMALPLLPLLERILPARVTTAIRSRIYPGPIKPLDEGEVAKPGRWRG
jgi:hypothetical protein